MGRALAIGFAALVAMATPAAPQTAGAPAENYPNQLVRIVSPFSAGSGADIIARTAAEKLSERWRQQVIVENRLGVAGTASVAKAPADGYTLMVTANGHTVLGETNPNLPFDPLKDFAGVAQVASLPFILVANPDLKATTLNEFIAVAKARPGTLNFASSGFGSTTYLVGALFTQVAKLKMQHVPYRGGPEAVTSVLRGDSHIYFATSFASRELIEAGRLRGLAVTPLSRLPMLPNVPTFAEAGLPELRYDSWFGLMAPASVPRPIIEKISRDVVEIFSDPALRARLAGQGILVATKTASEFDAVIKSDAERFSKLLKETAK